MSLNACAEIVRRGDPDRFRAAMAAKPDARRVLFPIYAMNVEVARAPFVVSEPMLGEIRLQWWHDALGEIAEGGGPRRHEVVTPLAEILDAEGARILQDVVAARQWEVAREPFADAGQLSLHVGAIAGSLMWAAARALGAADEDQVRGTGFAGGLAGWFVAVPDLAGHGLQALPDDGDDAIRALAEKGLSRLSGVSAEARPAALAAWEARPILERARRDPARVREGRLERAPAAKAARLIRMSLLG